MKTIRGWFPWLVRRTGSTGSHMPLKFLSLLLFIILMASSALPSYSFTLDPRKRSANLSQRKAKEIPAGWKFSNGVGSSSFLQHSKDDDYGTVTNKSFIQLPASLTNYYLLWSPRMLRSTGIATVALWIILRLVPWEGQAIQKFSWLQNNQLLSSGLLPTLSSACCWIQLLLNMTTAAGCAGFNRYIGPLRPLFLSVLAYLTVAARDSTPISAAILRWAIALLPEILHAWNNSYDQRQAWIEDWSRREPKATARGDDRMVSIYLDCPTMGCVACINKIDSSLRTARMSGSSAHIEDAKSWLLTNENRKGGKAKITISVPEGPEEEFIDKSIVPALLRSVESAGFPCRVDAIQRI